MVAFVLNRESTLLCVEFNHLLTPSRWYTAEDGVQQGGRGRRHLWATSDMWAS